MVTAYGQPAHTQHLLDEQTDCSLMMLAVGNPKQAHVDTSQKFHNLVNCQLHWPLAAVLDVSPLQHLKQLSYINLQYGCFSNLHIQPMLTALILRRADVSVCGDMRQLYISDLALNDQTSLHRHDGKPVLHYCTAVTRLFMLDNALDDNSRKHSKLVALSKAVLQMPLRHISIFVGSIQGRGSAEVCLDQFGKLPALRALELHIRGGSVTGQVSCLQGLTALKVSAPARASSTPQFDDKGNELKFLAPIRLVFDWEKLTHLKAITLAGPVTANSNILKIASISGLTILNLQSAEFCSEPVYNHFTSLRSKIRKRVQVYFPKVEDADGNIFET